MNKKFMAVLLVIVMVVSMVPMTALADEHEHEIAEYVSDNSGTHKAKCSCGFEYDFIYQCSNNDNDYDGTCDKCGYTYRVVTPPAPHEHNMVAHSNNDNKTHNKSCNCGLNFNESCSDNNVVDGFCDDCGGFMYSLPDDKPHSENDHEFTIVDNGDGTHSGSCKCGVTMGPVAHDYTGDGVCDCGKKCPHEFKAWADKGEGHDVNCRDCGQTVETGAAHVIVNGYCDCGAHEHDYIADRNGDGTHNLICVCGGKVENLKCSDGNKNDGLCDTCGYRLYEDPTQNEDFKHDEHNYVAHSNNNGTHNTSCNCGLGESNVACADADKDGKCDDCGYVLPVEPVAPVAPVVPQEPVELPTYATASAVGLDNVPKTGCAFVEWLYALIFG